MTSPVSAVEAIERFERAVRANGYRTSDDQTEAEYQAAKAAVLALARQAEALKRENAQKDSLQKVVNAVLTWAELRCPCHNDQPNPCPLCGASVENLEPCKSAENTLPRHLLADLRRARTLLKEEANAE